MRLLGLSLIALLPCAAPAAVQLQPSPALQQLQQIDAAQQPDGRTDTAAAAGGLGFTVQTLEPVGYVNAQGAVEEAAPQQPQATPRSGHYVFDGKTPIKGVTIYTPKDDPDGKGKTEKPKPQGPVSDKLVYGALGVGAAATVGGLFFAPLLFLGGLLLGAGAVLFFLNKKFAK